jgi:arylsulfatase A-like enzyme
VRFSRYFTSSNDCTPTRTTQATGLYTHQTGIFATTPPRPTSTSGFRPTARCSASAATTRTGSASGTCPAVPTGRARRTRTSPTASWRTGRERARAPRRTGAPARARRWIRRSASSFVDWLGVRAPGGNPWQATVSFVNPHDIAWYGLVPPDGAPKRMWTKLLDLYLRLQRDVDSGPGEQHPRRSAR